MIGKLTNLRYLALNGFRERELPKSVGNLVFLETLDVRRSEVRLPNVIWKMIRLRHLYLAGRTEIIGGGGLRLDTLKQLQTLSGEGIKWRVRDLVKLTNLKKLKAIWLTTDMAKTIVDCVVDGLDNLRSLTLHMFSGNNVMFPSLEGLSRKRHLLKLKFYGKMASFPSNWPSNLVKLQLLNSRIKEDPMPILEKLQHLEYLEIYRSPIERRMVCSTDGFPQLQHLRLEWLNKLEEWIVEKGAMSSLTTLQIESCDRLKKIPEGLKFLTQLKELGIHTMSDSFNKRVKEGGEDWQSVQHIPSITIGRGPMQIRSCNTEYIEHFLSMLVTQMMMLLGSMLFKLVHSKNFNVGVQALLLLDTLSSKNQVVSDMFYRPWYLKLLVPAAMNSSKAEMFIGLLLTAMKSDVNIRRVTAFSDRLMQVAPQQPPQFACGCLFILSEVLKARPPLWNMVLQ